MSWVSIYRTIPLSLSRFQEGGGRQWRIRVYLFFLVFEQVFDFVLDKGCSRSIRSNKTA